MESGARQLVVIAGPDKGRTFDVQDAEPLQIGRGGSTATRLNDLKVSRKHCRVEVDGGRVLLTDENSTTGTFVNDQKITQHHLRSGDIIRLGETQLRFIDEADVAEAATIGGADLAKTLGAAPAPPKAVPGAKEPLSELVGTTLEQYEIGPITGRGVTSVVFRARDPGEDRDAALKIFRPEFAKSEGEIQRFARSMQAVFPLRHPNLIALYGAGRSKGYSWIAMELVDGESLTQLIQRVGMAGMLDWQHALRIAMHMAKALDYVHSHQLVHRNITPRTILIDNASDKLAKLGALLRSKSTDGSMETPIRSDDLLRDAPYLPPERVRDVSHGDTRSDVYSLGATVYALITGKPPFEGRTPVETIAKILQTDPMSPREYQLALPESIEQVILRMLAKKPDERYQKAADLLADLEKIAKNPMARVGDVHAPAKKGTDHDLGTTPFAPPRAETPPPTPGSVSVTCACGNRMQARERYAGTRVRCPRCGTFVLLPGRPGLDAPMMQQPMPTPQPMPVQQPMAPMMQPPALARGADATPLATPPQPPAPLPQPSVLTPTALAPLPPLEQPPALARGADATPLTPLPPKATMAQPTPKTTQAQPAPMSPHLIPTSIDPVPLSDVDYSQAAPYGGMPSFKRSSSKRKKPVIPLPFLIATIGIAIALLAGLAFLLFSH